MKGTSTSGVPASKDSASLFFALSAFSSLLLEGWRLVLPQASHS